MSFDYNALLIACEVAKGAWINTNSLIARSYVLEINETSCIATSAIEAIKLSENSYPNTVGNDERDACRQGVWSALLVEIFGAIVAEKVTTAYENAVQNSTDLSRQMGLYNNQIGRQLASGKYFESMIECGDLIINAINRGDFKKIVNNVLVPTGQSEFYSSKTMKTVGKFKYNCDKILNINPNFASNIYHEWYMLEHNINELLNTFPYQFTSRQKSYILSILNQYNNYCGYNDIVEFRFEGAGSYRSGSSDDGFNPIKATIASIDFRNYGGQHNEIGMPDGFNDGIGLYGALCIVIRDAEIMGVFFRASTLPDKVEIFDTAMDGVYNFRVGIHPMRGGSDAYKALNLYTLSGSRTLPTIIERYGEPGIKGVNSHKGWLNERGSEGCQTIPYENNDYNDYISLFNTGEEGKFIIERVPGLLNHLI